MPRRRCSTGRPSKGRRRARGAPPQTQDGSGDIARFAEIMLTNGGVRELRAPNTRTKSGDVVTITGLYDDPTQLAETARKLSGRAEAVYITLNPVEPALLAATLNEAAPDPEQTATDSDMRKREFLLINIEAVRPSEASSTDEDHGPALDVAREIQASLSGLAWPDPILADNGTGANLLFRVDLENDKDSPELVKNVLCVLDLHFGNEQVTVRRDTDGACCPVTFYGTETMKGEDCAERPRRVSKLLHVPEPLEAVPRELLDSVAAHAVYQARSAVRHRDADIDLEAWIDLAREKGLPTPVRSGPWRTDGYKYLFDKCPFNGKHELRLAAYLVRSPNGRIEAGCCHDACEWKGWQDLRIRYEPHWPSYSGDYGNSGHEVEVCEPPVPFHRRRTPVFPVDALPSWLADWVAAVATALQVPVDLPALLALACLAVAIAGKAKAQPRKGWLEPLCLFVLVVLEPASRKSPVFARATAPIYDYERSLRHAASTRIQQAHAERDVLERRLKEAQKKAVQPDPGEREQAEALVRDCAVEIASHRVPSQPRLVVDDITAEQLATLLCEQNGRMALLSAEGGIFSIMDGRYSRDGSPNLEVFLKGHSGDPLRVDRRGRAEYVDDPALTLGLTVQPDVLSGFPSSPVFRGRGLLGRFLYGCPESLVGRREVAPPPVPDHVAATYERRLRELLVATSISIPIMLFGHEAGRQLDKFDREIESQLGLGGDLSGIQDWAGKLVGQVVRVAALLHMAEHGENGFEVDVCGTSVDRAIQIGRYLIPHAQLAYSEMGADPEIANACHLLRWIERARHESFTKRDAYQATKGRFRRVAELEPILDRLENHGYIRKRPLPPRCGRGRKPSPVYDVNPYVYSHISQNPHKHAKRQPAEHDEAE
ncbi:YfjI family protein [Planctomycetota bacterium]